MDQARALEIMIAGENVFVTGAPGSGKTYVLNKFIRHARAVDKHVSVTATTGLAATHLNGTTIHAWSGIGIREKLPPKFSNSLPQNRVDSIKDTDILIIDEVSMMHDFQLDMVDEILRTVRNNDLPFGGIQIILCGDFFQLPPVNREKKLTSSFITHSDAWDTSNLVICYLNEQHRQKDNSYTEILQALRNNDLRRRHAEALLSRVGAAEQDNTVTQLHTTRANVDAINLGYLAQLKGKAHKYLMETDGNATYIETLKKSCLASDKLLLKKGALVMCIRNDPKRQYVNGSLGTVIGFDRSTKLPKVRLKNGRQCVISPAIWELHDGDKRRAGLSQIPLQLAWAITVHKSQGMTLDAACVDLRKAFVEGMGYVALSRLRDLESLSLVGINKTALQVSSEAVSIDQQLRGRAEEDAKQFAYLRHQASNKKTIVESSKKLKILQHKHPNAYKPWSAEDDVKLGRLLTNGLNTSLKKLAQTFGRQQGSIRSRIKKQFKDLNRTKNH